MASMAKLMLVTSNCEAPSMGRQAATAGICAPTKTPVELLRNERRPHPTRSKASQAHISNILTCASADLASLWDNPNKVRSKSFSRSSRIRPS